MEGYQFAHMETYSVKGAPGADPDATARKKNGQRAWTAKEIFDEAERVELASMHVAEGGPPPEIMPGTLAKFEELRAAHAKAASVKESFDYTKKDGTKQQRRRKLRSDAPTLHTTIISLPVTSTDALRDPAILQKCRKVLRNAMTHETKRIAGLGGELAMGVIHLDETHVHAHLYSIDRARGRVDRLHPGKAAKATFHDEHRGSGHDPKDVRKAGNKAYCDAMREWQDDFHQNVFSSAGLLRLGPKAQRLTTAEYRKQKQAKAEQAKEAARSAALTEEIARQATQLADAVRRKTEADEESARHRRELQEQEAKLAAREERAAQSKKLGRDWIARGRDIKATAEAYEHAVKRGTEAIRDREIDYRPPTAEKKAGLVFGPAASEDKSLRKSLQDAIRPAYDFLVGVAEWAFGVRIREEEVKRREAEQKRQEEAREVEVAELRRQASVVSDSLRKVGQSAAPALEAIATGRQASYCEASFPGAWFVDRSEKIEMLNERLNATGNLDLRAAYLATSDAVLIIEDDDALREKARLGMRVIEAGASLRGFDLETGRHDPDKAKDPKLATLHTDQHKEWDVIMRRNPQRVRVRGN